MRRGVRAGQGGNWLVQDRDPIAGKGEMPARGWSGTVAAVLLRKPMEWRALPVLVHGPDGHVILCARQGTRA
jgi:hypothetical protein